MHRTTKAWPEVRRAKERRVRGGMQHEEQREKRFQFNEQRRWQKVKERKRNLLSKAEKQLKVCDSGKILICQRSWCLHTFLFSNSPPVTTTSYLWVHTPLSSTHFSSFHLPPPLSLFSLIAAGACFYASKREREKDYCINHKSINLCLLSVFISPPITSAGPLSHYLLVNKRWLATHPKMGHGSGSPNSVITSGTLCFTWI